MSGEAPTRKQRGNFPTTTSLWTDLEGLPSAKPGDRARILDVVSRRYWSPLHQYVRRRGQSPADAEDTIQGFFAFAFRTDLFGKADRTRGKFRSFLIGSLNNYISNQGREERALKRSPSGGEVSIDDIMEAPVPVPPGMQDRQTPDAIFHEVWLRELIMRVLSQLEEKMTRREQQTHFELFRARVMGPILDGDPLGSLQEQAAALKLDYKVAASQIDTAKRAFRKLLLAEIEHYAFSRDDADDDEQDVLRLLAWDT